MEAFRTITRGVLPPSGNPVVVDEAQAGPPDVFTGFDTRWLDSGTSALAAALLEAKRGHASIKQPAVIIPAYCCPDLVSAAVYAGLKPVAVDLAESDTRYDLEKLSKAIDASTIAIIAINFMGIRENLGAIRAISDQYSQCSVIEDNAQWFPTAPSDASLAADFTIFSFGRGKPVSLLGGGLLVGKGLTEVSLPGSETGSENNGRASTLAKYFLYNRLLHPRLYQLIDRNPLLSVGETRYKALSSIAPLDNLRRRIVKANIEQYSRIDQSPERFYLAALKDYNQLRSINSPDRGRLLRFPLLVPTEQDQCELFARLKQEGLGVTKLYQKALPHIDGLPEAIHCPFSIENAESLSRRLLTLPVHQGVTQQHLSKTLAVVSQYFS